MKASLRMYGEDIVREIMIATAICVQEMIVDDPKATHKDLFEFVDRNFRNIIDETLRSEWEEEEQEGQPEGNPEFEGEG